MCLLEKRVQIGRIITSKLCEPVQMFQGWRRNCWAEQWEISGVFLQIVNGESVLQTVVFQGCGNFIVQKLIAIYRFIVLSKL